MAHYRVLIPLHIDPCDETGKLLAPHRDIARQLIPQEPGHGLVLLVTAENDDDVLRQLGKKFTAIFTDAPVANDAAPSTLPKPEAP